MIWQWDYQDLNQISSKSTKTRQTLQLSKNCLQLVIVHLPLLMQWILFIAPPSKNFQMNILWYIQKAEKPNPEHCSWWGRLKLISAVIASWPLSWLIWIMVKTHRKKKNCVKKPHEVPDSKDFSRDQNKSQLLIFLSNYLFGLEREGSFMGSSQSLSTNVQVCHSNIWNCVWCLWIWINKWRSSQK